jgi:hypothetical protein
MFRPTQTFSSPLAIATIVIGFVMAVALVVIGVTNLAHPLVPEEYLARNSQTCGLLCVTALMIVYAVIRPHPGGLVLCATAVAVYFRVPTVAVAVFVLGLLVILRAYHSRKQLARQESAGV